MSIGEHIPDALQNITGGFNPYADSDGGLGLIAPDTVSGAFYSHNPYENTILRGAVAVTAGRDGFIGLDASRVARTAAETRIATVSVYVCITY
jgi:hypothetical protein